MEIKEADLIQVPAIAAMWQAIDDCVPEQPFGGNTEEKKSRALAILTQAIHSQHAYVLVAEENRQILGTISGHLFQRPTSRASQIGVIYSLWVEKSVRCQGIGQSLLLMLEQKLIASGAQAFQVGWDTQNQLAQDWWQKRGYRAYETIASKCPET